MGRLKNRKNYFGEKKGHLRLCHAKEVERTFISRMATEEQTDRLCEGKRQRQGEKPVRNHPLEE